MAASDRFEQSVNYAKNLAGITFSLKDKQLECIRNVLEGRDTISLLPTGYGKSLIYTLLPHVLDHFHGKPVGHHIVVVVSPLVALMEEQTTKINDYGIPAVYLGSTDLTAGKFSITISIG
jgi:superfamily II DNA helicase RecQ